MFLLSFKENSDKYRKNFPRFLSFRRVNSKSWSSKSLSLRGSRRKFSPCEKDPVLVISGSQVQSNLERSLKIRSKLKIIGGRGGEKVGGKM